MAALTALLNFLYPPQCAACGASFDLDADTRVCASCLARVEPLPPPLCSHCGGPMESAAIDHERCARCVAAPPRFRRARSIARYRPSTESDPASLPALIRRHKYGLDQTVAPALAEYLGRDLPIAAWPRPGRAGTASSQEAMVAWIQSAALLAAWKSAGAWRFHSDTQVLVTRATNPQTYRHHDERLRNVRRAFAAPKPDRIAGKAILLVDDVMTTGATVEECARTLLEAGARAVDVFTLARVL